MFTHRRCRHISTSIRGLAALSDQQLDEISPSIKVEGKPLKTAAQVRELLDEALAAGFECIPAEGCDNFDARGLCMGHEMKGRVRMSELNIIEPKNNVEFDVHYDAFNREHVTEGILYEVKGDTFVMHLGTDNANVLYAVIDATTQVIKQLGLTSDFLKYMSGLEEENTIGGVENGQD